MNNLTRLVRTLQRLAARLPFVPISEPEPEPPVRRVKGHYMSELLAKMPYIDDLDAAERADNDDALRSALEMSRPPNWWGTGASQNLLRIARAEGLPLAFVPRRETIKELDSAPDADARLAILVAHADEIIADCEDLLEECADEDLQDQVGLAKLAINAIKAGHYQAGMALAVGLGEPLAVWASTPRVRAFDSKEEKAEWERKRKERRKYEFAQIEIDRLPPGDVEPWDFNDHILMAPVPRFFTSFFREKGDPVPKSLSRHAVVHQPTLAHFSESNALLSIMLVSSILYAEERWIENVRADDSHFDPDP